jgi:hypothetical protein
LAEARTGVDDPERGGRDADDDTGGEGSACEGGATGCCGCC